MATIGEKELRNDWPDEDTDKLSLEADVDLTFASGNFA